MLNAKYKLVSAFRLQPLALLLAFSLPPSTFATSYTEFFCRSDGANINSGHTTNAVATYTSVNGNWDSTTGIFVPTDASTPASTVTNGAWASVYIDGATVAVYIGRITNVVAGVAGAISVNPLPASGAAPSTSATGRSIKVGGAWQGPNGASGFPFSFIKLNMTNSAYDRPWVNLLNAADYNVSAAISQANNGPLGFSGYSVTPRDGGQAIITGNGVGSAIALMTLNGNQVTFTDFILRSNGTSSTALMLGCAGANQVVSRVRVNASRGIGISATGTGITLAECTAFGNGLGNTANDAGFSISSGVNVKMLRCLSYSNTPANVAGFFIGDGTLMDCISAFNGTNGFTILSGSGQTYLGGCGGWSNAGSGLQLRGTINTTIGSVFVENVNFLKNAQFGIDCQASISNRTGIIRYVGLGSGTAANALGGFNIGSTLSGAIDIQTNTFVTYASGATPWSNPDTGDFRIANVTAWGTGRGNYLQTGAFTNTVSYVDLGGAQHLGVTNATSSVFAQ